VSDRPSAKKKSTSRVSQKAALTLGSSLSAMLAKRAEMGIADIVKRGYISGEEVVTI
jgi:hypothetical protein